ncbi:MAG TPA: putative quinol monooxygenase [Baekduia sp.]|nr:putative quinol monooxygenase [Baekduia sp.]
MSLSIHAEIHGLAGRAGELRDLLAEHAARLAGADGCLGAAAHEPVGGDPGEFVLLTRWRDEAAMRAHYVTPDYTRYSESIGELLARPSDVRIDYVEREVRATADLSQDPTRQG